MPPVDDPKMQDVQARAQQADDTGLLDDFWRLTKEQGKLVAWVVAGAATTPLVLGLAGIDPPWPESVTIVTAFGQLLAMVWAYQTLREKKNDAAIEVAMRFYLRLLAFFVAIYFLIHSFFVFTRPTDHGLGVKGFVCLSNILRLPSISSYCPFVPIEKLKDFGYDTDMVFTGWSISAVQYLILVLWIASFYTLAFFLAAFVVNQQNKAAKSKGQHAT